MKIRLIRSDFGVIFFFDAVKALFKAGKKSNCSAMLCAASASGVCVFAHLRYRRLQ